MMIRPITNFSLSNNQNKPAFTAKSLKPQGAFKFYKNVLKEDKKKFSGIIDCYFPDKKGNDGQKIVLEFKKGILQTAERFSEPFCYLLKFTPEGAKTIKVKKPIKSLYKKEYKYSDATGELMQVTKNGTPVFNKTYHINPYFDYPIEMHINDNIITHYDQHNNKKYATIVDKYLRSEFIYNDSEKYYTEFRQLLEKNSFDNIVRLAQKGKPLPPNTIIESIPLKAITHIKNPKAEDSLQITKYGLNAKPMQIKGYNKKRELSYVINCEYGLDGRLLRRYKTNLLPVETKQVDEFNSTGLPIRTRLYSSDDKILEDVSRKFDVNGIVPALKVNIHKYFDANEHLARIDKDIETGNMHIQIHEIYGQDRQVYKAETRFNIDTNTIINQRFYSPSKEEITEKEFIKAVNAL